MAGKTRSGLRNRKAEFALAAAMVAARTRAGLTQDELAHRMRTTQPVVARLESGRVWPSTRTLERYAFATGSRLRILFEPSARRARRGGEAVGGIVAQQR